MLLLDRILASADERRDAAERVAHALRSHGADAVDYLKSKLADPRRRRSRRAIRLAIAELRER